jgi:uncharacterized protein
MLLFRPVTLSDKTLINNYLQKQHSRLFTYSFEVLFLFRDVYDFQIAEFDNHLLIKTYVDGCHYFLFPVGDDTVMPSLEAMLDHSFCLDCAPVIGQITPENKVLMERLMPDKFRFIPSRNEYEYIYASEKLATLSGKALQSKRNHINFVEKNYAWQFEPITSENIGECIAFNDEWDYHYNDDPESKRFTENKALDDYFRFFEQMPLHGGCLRFDGKVVAIAVGYPLNEEVYLYLFEKASHLHHGAYALINREMIRYYAKNYTYVNRAEDGGVEGLRKAKMSYNPAILQEVYLAELVSRP